ncbi:hypothetical protein D0865_01762 [Hortaea werneckii]|uniref:C2H2-type domain-containing protein n=1 Tax=Hortaea werneckii TaxID=91943 RepID=A0A3M7D6Z5_HORWE|nr:hypothetical protein D0865_01762 [Hortaea werneckii]
MANRYPQYPYGYGQPPTQQSYYQPTPYQTAQQYPTQYPTGYQQPQQPTVQPQSSAPQYPCLYAQCQISFTRHGDLQRHMNSIHNRATLDLVPCTYVDPATGRPCHRHGEFGFTRRDKMIAHMRAVHKVEAASAAGRRREG